MLAKLTIVNGEPLLLSPDVVTSVNGELDREGSYVIISEGGREWGLKESIAEVEAAFAQARRLKVTAVLPKGQGTSVAYINPAAVTAVVPLDDGATGNAAIMLDNNEVIAMETVPEVLVMLGWAE